MTSFPAVINLSSLDGGNGFQINGEAAGDLAGVSVSSAGDINGDGFADVIVGAWGADTAGTRSGAAYVVFGTSAGWGPNLQLSSLNGSNGFQINGQAGSIAGWSVSSVGDVNGDGLSDVIIGAPEALKYGISSGAAYVVFGKTAGFSPELNLSTLNGTNGFSISGNVPSSQVGAAVSSAGDVNGDGFGDLLVGSPSYNNAAGYLVFGKQASFGANIDLGSLNGSNGARFNPVPFNYGGQVSAAGDVNGDGFDDFIINDPWSGPNQTSVSYVVFGRSSGFPAVFDFASLNGANGFSITGGAASTLFGFSSAPAGDINGDGFDDLIFGAPLAGFNGQESGSSYVVFGKASGFAATLNVSSLNGTNGFRIDGEAVSDRSGGRVSGAGDFNADGFADLIVGAQGADPNGPSSGASYVVFGDDAGFAPILKLSSLDGNNGFKIIGEAALDDSGVVSAAGDVNGDGFDDLLVGAPHADPNGADSGAAYVLFGHSSGVATQTPTDSSGSYQTDFNDDGNADLLWQNATGEVAIWVLNGFNVATQASVANPGPSWHIKGSGDFNADGESDLLMQNVNGQTAIWLLNGTTITSGALLSTSADPSWHIKGIGDYNADGRSDIVWQNDNGQAAVSLVNGTSAQSRALVATNPGPSWHIKGTGDFDGDGKSDLLWQNDSGQAAIWLIDGTSFTSGALVATNPGPSWHIKGAGDFNGDGKSDILWQNDSGQAAIWLMNGTALIAGAYVGTNPGPSWHIKGSGDFNADGKSDIVLRNDSGQAAIWLLDSHNLIAAANVGSNPGAAWHLDWS